MKRKILVNAENRTQSHCGSLTPKLFFTHSTLIEPASLHLALVVTRFQFFLRTSRH